ncbi:hypothetical protein A2U01_0087797, partial [Trifolium medium]|nr:hypothetical protein [Trifolium medium]
FKCGTPHVTFPSGVGLASSCDPPAIVLTATRLLSPLLSSPLSLLGGYLSCFGGQYVPLLRLL